MRYIQFFSKSTGYVQGTIPPKFDPAHVKPIPACGSDGVVFLDGRVSRSSTINAIATAHNDRLRKIGRGFVGFQVYGGASILTAKPVGMYSQLTGE